MKKQRLTDLELKLTQNLSSLIETPFRIVCSYHERCLRVTLINLITGKSYLIATMLGSKTKDGHAFIDFFYVMPQFMARGIGHILIEQYAALQALEGFTELHLKPLPFVPGSKEPIEYMRLSYWLGGKDYKKMNRRQLVDFYKSVGFVSLNPDDLEAEMKMSISA